MSTRAPSSLENSPETKNQLPISYKAKTKRTNRWILKAMLVESKVMASCQRKLKRKNAKASKRRDPTPEIDARSFISQTSMKSDQNFDTHDLPEIGNVELLVAQEECKILRAQETDLRERLREAEGIIFSQFPQERSITEVEARAKFVYICGAVEEWVDTMLLDAVEDRLLAGEKLDLSSQAKAQRLFALIPAAGQEAMAYAGTDGYNLMAVIMMFLHREVFGNDLGGAVDEDTVKFIASIERDMRNLQPQRGPVTRRTWHTETYAAIANGPNFVNQRERRIDELVLRLSDILHIFVPRTSEGDFQLSLRTSIIEPAFSLAQKLSLSIDEYFLEWSDNHDLTFKKRYTPLIGFQEFDIVDVRATSRVLKSIPERSMLVYISDMSPQLVLRAANGEVYGKRRVLKKPKILAAISQGDYHWPQMAPSRPGQEVTLLGWLEWTIHRQSNTK
ncbi:hypothetical protein BUE80_DR011588 [Diplocarpon rosae]|nr:hypothetical protein BUE80_DR011588 [Diplocarpon rosae]